MNYYGNKTEFKETEKAMQRALGGAYFRLQSGARTRVVFLGYPEDFVSYFDPEIRKKLIVGEGYAAPNEDQSVRFAVALYNLDTASHQIWECSATVVKDIKEAIEIGKYEGQIFAIKREGEGLKTKYRLNNLDPMDMSQIPEIGFKSARDHIDEMQRATIAAINAGEVEAYGQSDGDMPF